MQKMMSVILLLGLLVCCACAEAATMEFNVAEAPDITRSCSVGMTGVSGSERKNITDGRYKTVMHMKPGATVTIDSGNMGMSGLFVRFYETPVQTTVEALVGKNWVTVGTVGAEYLTEWIDLPDAVTQVRLVNNTRQPMILAEVSVYGTGEWPKNIHTWRRADKADMLLLVAHPDDELLWFAGLLPTYAGERKLNVQVAYVAPTNGMRRLELLDGLWTCGVDIYPAFLEFHDAREMTLDAMLRVWGADNLYHAVTDLIRTCRPEVMVTQAFSGEYGHGAHRAMADAASKCVRYAADDGYKTGKALPAWQTKKLYIHLYDQNRITMDWEQPLTAFDGETSLSVASRALDCHVSQSAGGRWTMKAGTKPDTDYTQFGLYYSVVGSDVVGGDFMENIPVAQEGGAQ